MVEFFVYKCSTNNGLETLVQPEDDTTPYDERNCETLDRIIFWDE